MAHWTTTHAALIAKHAKTLGILRYIQVHTLPELGPRQDPIRGQMAPPYDGLTLVWFDDNARGADDAVAAAHLAIAEDESKFLDFEKSANWLGRESPVVVEAERC